MKKQEEKETNASSQVKEALKESIQGSTFHGVPNIYRSKNLILKLFWIVCFLGSTAFCSYSIAKSILDFIEYRVVTHISSIYENPIEFPLITVNKKKIILFSSLYLNK